MEYVPEPLGFPLSPILFRTSLPPTAFFRILAAEEIDIYQPPTAV